MKTERVILHCDLNHCYAQIEEMKYPELRNICMAVGGSEASRHGIILAKNDLAKTYNIKTGESLRDALKKCPHLLILPPNYQDYLYHTKKVKDIYRSYSDKVESFGLDEAWIDVTGSQNLFGNGETIAQIIQQRVYEELGLTISIGVSYNKILAKFGSDLDKEMGLVIITKENIEEIVWKADVGELFYVGRATKRKLNKLNIYTIGDLANSSYAMIKKELGKMGELIWYFANGIDECEVAYQDYYREVKSVGNSITAIRDIINYEEAKNVFYVLVESVASRLKDHNLIGSVISISLRNKNLESITRQLKIEKATNTTKDIIRVVMHLLTRNYFFEKPLRSIGVSVSKLIPDGDFEQLNLFEDIEDSIINKKIDIVMDNIRNKHGFDKIKRVSTLINIDLTSFNPKNDHIIHPISFF